MAEPIITLLNSTNNQPLRKWRATQKTKGGIIIAGNFVVGKEYEITTVGTTDFTLIGSADNNIGTRFIATDIGSGDGTTTEIITSYHVKADSNSETLDFLVWNNKKQNCVIDLTIETECTISDNVVVRINDVDYTIAVSIQSDTDIIANEIKTNLDAEVAFNTSEWSVSVLPRIESDGQVVRYSTLVFESNDFLAKGGIGFTPNTTGITGTIVKMLEGNESTTDTSKVTDMKLIIRDDTGGVSGDVVNDKWAYAKDENDLAYVNLGVDTNPITFDTTEYDLSLKAINASVLEGEILGTINTGSLTDDSNFDRVYFYMHPPLNVSQGLRPWKLVMSYNFT